jgi:hypothetical protein
MSDPSPITFMSVKKILVIILTKTKNKRQLLTVHL